MEIIGISLDAIQSFLAYLVTATALTLIYVFVYIWVTPHPEFKLIRENNLAASVAFAGSLVGFSLPLASVIAHSVALTDCVIWGLIAIFVQIFIFFWFVCPYLEYPRELRKAKPPADFGLGQRL